MEDYYEGEIHHGRLYPNLDALVEECLLEKGEIDKRTNRYTSTEQGRQFLEDRRAWEDQFVDELQSG